MGLYVQRLLVFLPLFMLWFCLLGLAGRLMKAGAAGSPGSKRLIASRGDLFWTGLLLVCAAAVLFALQYFRLRLAVEVFYLATAVMAAGGLEQLFSARRCEILAVIAGWVFYSGSGYLSFVVLGQVWDWQALLLAAGPGFIICAVCASRRLSLLALGEYSRPLRGGGQAQILVVAEVEPRFCRLSMIYPFLICLSSLCPATLAFFHYLPRAFTLMVAIVPVAAGLITRLQLSRRHQRVPERFVQETVSIACLYMLAMLLLFFFTSLI